MIPLAELMARAHHGARFFHMSREQILESCAACEFERCDPTKRNCGARAKKAAIKRAARAKAPAKHRRERLAYYYRNRERERAYSNAYYRDPDVLAKNATRRRNAYAEARAAEGHTVRSRGPQARYRWRTA